jgi:hypothetical protein
MSIAGGRNSVIRTFSVPLEREGREVWVITVMHHSEHSRSPTHSGHLFAHQASDDYSTVRSWGGGDFTATNSRYYRHITYISMYRAVVGILHLLTCCKYF